MIDRFCFARAAALLALAAPLPLLAQDDAVQPRLDADDFRIIHLWSTDPQGVIEAWNQPTPPVLQSELATVRGRPIQQFIFYANCMRDDAGRCHLAARVTITAPDGTAYSAPMEFDALPADVAPVPPGRIGMTPRSIGIRVEDDEPIGTYTVELALTDVNAGLTVTDTVEIAVAEAP